MIYNDQHRHFVQFMLRKGCVTKEKAIEFIAKVTESQPSLSQLKTFIGIVNEHIVQNNFKISCSNCEITGKEVIMWLNTRNDSISKVQNTFSAIELEYFQVIMREIVISQEHYLPGNICLNLSSTLTGNLSKSDAEKLAAQWTKLGYFVTEKGKIFLGPRCIQEFSSYFNEHCKDYMNTCSLCSETVFFGESCDSCEQIFHRLCIKKFLQKKKVCPSCKDIWIEENENSQEEEQNQNSQTEEQEEEEMLTSD